jgi:pimeloyl-ACP methyl ester carboxylesterase
MHVERYGHGGTPVLLVHGFGTSSFVWRNVAPALAIANCTAFAVDLFGYGESDRPFDADFGIASQAEYLDRALTALRLPTATDVETDDGGAVALRLAAARVERVDRLVLVNPVALDELPGEDIRALNRNTARFAFRVSRGVLGAAPLLTELLRGSVSEASHMPDALIARYLAPYVGREGVDHLLALARAIDGEDMEGVELNALPQPVLMVWGELDPWVDAKFADRLADVLPDCRVARLPGVSRLVPEEAPEALAGLVLDFLSAARRP